MKSNIAKLDKLAERFEPPAKTWYLKGVKESKEAIEKDVEDYYTLKIYDLKMRRKKFAAKKAGRTRKYGYCQFVDVDIIKGFDMTISILENEEKEVKQLLEVKK